MVRRDEHDLQRAVDAQRADEHEAGEDAPGHEVPAHGHVVGAVHAHPLGEDDEADQREPEEAVGQERGHAEGAVLLPLHDAGDDLGDAAVEDAHGEDHGVHLVEPGVVDVQQDGRHAERHEAEGAGVGRHVAQRGHDGATLAHRARGTRQRRPWFVTHLSMPPLSVDRSGWSRATRVAPGSSHRRGKPADLYHEAAHKPSAGAHKRADSLYWRRTRRTLEAARTADARTPTPHRRPRPPPRLRPGGGAHPARLDGAPPVAAQHPRGDDVRRDLLRQGRQGHRRRPRGHRRAVPLGRRGRGVVAPPGDGQVRHRRRHPPVRRPLVRLAAAGRDRRRRPAGLRLPARPPARPLASLGAARPALRRRRPARGGAVAHRDPRHLHRRVDRALRPARAPLRAGRLEDALALRRRGRRRHGARHQVVRRPRARRRRAHHPRRLAAAAPGGPARRGSRGRRRAAGRGAGRRGRPAGRRPARGGRRRGAAAGLRRPAHRGASRPRSSPSPSPSTC